MSIYLAYVLGFFITAFWLDVWFRSTLFIHVASLFSKKVTDSTTFDDLIEIIDDKCLLLSELLVCSYCLGFWVSLLVSVIMGFWFGFWFVVIAVMTWPFLYSRIFH